MLFLIVLGYFILGSTNLFLYFNDKTSSFLCNRNTLHIFVIFLVHTVANGLPLMFLLNTHHNSYRKNQSNEPSNVDVTFYDDLHSEESDDRRQSYHDESNKKEPVFYDMHTRSATDPNILD